MRKNSNYSWLNIRTICVNFKDVIICFLRYMYINKHLYEGMNKVITFTLKCSGHTHTHMKHTHTHTNTNIPAVLLSRSPTFDSRSRRRDVLGCRATWLFRWHQWWSTHAHTTRHSAGLQWTSLGKPTTITRGKRAWAIYHRDLSHGVTGQRVGPWMKLFTEFLKRQVYSPKWKAITAGGLSRFRNRRARVPAEFSISFFFLKFV